MTEQRTPRRTRNDLVLIAVILVMAAVGALYLFVFRPGGNTVRVTVDGKEYGTYSLAQDRVVEIRTGENESELNKLVIREGKAFVETATCPDGICANHAPVFRDGESIVCLPHGVVITVTLSQGEEGPDIVA